MSDEPTRLTFEGSPHEVGEELARLGWTDGLPVVPPTEDAVGAMLEGWDPAERLGLAAPGYFAVDLEQLAANAVMAGCRPAEFRVVVGAFEALVDPAFNLAAVQTTTHPVAPLLIVHGPVAAKLGVNGGAGVFGPGFRANATIGRAIRLALMNLGDARPGEGDRATHGSPAKYSFCIAENRELTPWPEYHVSLGLRPDEDAVTVVGCEPPHNVQDHQSTSGRRLLEIVADAIGELGHNGWCVSGGDDIVVVLGPEHARLLDRDNWTRRDVQQYLYHRASRPVREVEKIGLWENRDWPVWMNALALDPDALVPPVRRVEEIIVLVAGGPGKHTAVLPPVGASHAVSYRLRDPGDLSAPGTAVRRW